jgi:dephospho-CoA kinase
MAHSVYAPGSQAVKDVVAEFGSNILVQEDESKMEIDRQKLGAIVFADRLAMAKLERIVWPHVKTLIIKRIDDIRQQWKENPNPGTHPVIILEAAVLLDAEWDDLLDGIWVVTAPREVALQRLMETRGLSQDEAEKRINAQESRRGIGNLQQEIEQGVVTGVIENNGGLDELTTALKNALDDSSCWKNR